MWRSRRWQLLLDVLAFLPRTSAFAQALATDEELADLVADARDAADADDEAAWERSHRDYTAEVEMLTAVYDRIGELVRVTAAVHGAKPGPPVLGPRPRYAVQRIRKARTRQQHAQLVNRLIKKDTSAE